MDWLTASEALALLGTQKQTLYANVSRGRIVARPDPADSRRSLYRGDDVRRLSQRAAGRRKQEEIASEAMRWGEPILPTSLSTIVNGRLLYRGREACVLAETETLEAVAGLLWQAPLALVDLPSAGSESGMRAAFMSLASHAATARAASPVRSALLGEASLVLGTLVQSLAGPGRGAAHTRLAHRWSRPEAEDAIRRALVLLADHELNSSTFAARVAVSTGASLWSGALAGLATLGGPRHGLASPEVSALAEDMAPAGPSAEAWLRDWLGEGRHLPGMGHRLYPDGDPRCVALLGSFEVPGAFVRYAAAARSISGDAPNIDFALAALTVRFALPPDAGLTLFAMGRCVGWLAHMMEQIASGEQIRPRARYEGVI